MTFPAAEDFWSTNKPVRQFKPTSTFSQQDKKPYKALPYINIQCNVLLY